MILNKHRTQFNLEMTQGELKMIIAIIEGYQEIVLDSDIIDELTETVTFLKDTLHELTRFKRYAEAEHKYLEEEEAKADSRLR